MPPLLPRSFYARDALDVARDLLGRHLVAGGVTLRITETEAYRWPDSACHGKHGRTPRNEVMWGPPGRAYVYLCYGIHQMLNVVTLRDGVPNAVLIRACEPVGGLPTVRRRRGGRNGPVLLTGPGKVGAALGIDRTDDGTVLYRRGALELRDGPSPAGVLSGPRVGIGYADPADVAAPWRFAVADSPWVSHRGSFTNRLP